MTLRLLPSLVFSALSALSGSAWAFADGNNTVTTYVQAGYQHDSNLLRRDSASGEEADKIRILAAGVQLKLPVSLQTFTAGLDVQDVRFDRFTDLDYRSHRASAGWDWRLTPDIGGKLGWADERQPVQLKYLDQKLLDETKDRRLNASVFYRFQPEWQVEAGADDGRTTHTLQARQYLDNDSRGYSTGLRYLPTTGSSVALVAKRSTADYPNREVPVVPPTITLPFFLVDNGYTQRDLRLTADWRASETATVSAYAGQTKREHHQLNGRDFSGATGRLALDWLVSGKLRFVTGTWREIGGDEQSAFSSYAIRRGWNVEPTWYATPKVQAKLSWRQERLQYAGAPATAVGVEQRSDKEKMLSVSADYEVLTNVVLSLSHSREKRESNQAPENYRDRMTSLFIKASF